MSVILVPFGLLAAAAGIGYYWRESWARERVRVRLTDLEEDAVELPEQPFAVRHYVLPWVAAVITGAFVWYLLNFPWPISCGIVLVVGLLGMELDAWILEWKQGRMESQLADTIDTLVSSVGAGSSLQSALTRAAEYAPMPIKLELDEMVARLRLGDPPSDVFRLLSQRVPMETFRLFSTTLSVNWEAGGSLSETLAAVGGTIRDRLVIARQVRGLSVQGRLTTMTVLAVTWFMAAMMWQSDPPRFLGFVLSSVGIALMTVVLVLQGVGIAMVSKISRPKV
jgi:tight adherence protein B